MYKYPEKEKNLIPWNTIQKASVANEYTFSQPLRFPKLVCV